MIDEAVATMAQLGADIQFKDNAVKLGGERIDQGSIYWGGGGEASPPKVSQKKNLQLFQIKIFSEDDFKESVKVTNVQKCDFSRS